MVKKSHTYWRRFTSHIVSYCHRVYKRQFEGLNVVDFMCHFRCHFDGIKSLILAWFPVLFFYSKFYISHLLPCFRMSTSLKMCPRWSTIKNKWMISGLFLYASNPWLQNYVECYEMCLISASMFIILKQNV